MEVRNFMRPGASEKWQWRCSPPGAGNERNGLLAEWPGPSGAPRAGQYLGGKELAGKPRPPGAARAGEISGNLERV